MSYGSIVADAAATPNTHLMQYGSYRELCGGSATTGACAGLPNTRPLNDCRLGSTVRSLQQQGQHF